MYFFIRLFHKVGLGLRLFFFFIKEVLIANYAVAKKVLAPRLSLRSGIIALPLELKGDIPITLLANMITLTPGTLSVDLSPDRKFLFVHILDIDDPEEEKRKIKEGFEHYLQAIIQ